MRKQYPKSKVLIIILSAALISSNLAWITNSIYQTATQDISIQNTPETYIQQPEESQNSNSSNEISPANCQELYLLNCQSNQKSSLSQNFNCKSIQNTCKTIKLLNK